MTAQFRHLRALKDCGKCAMPWTLDEAGRKAHGRYLADEFPYISHLLADMLPTAVMRRTRGLPPVGDALHDSMLQSITQFAARDLAARN